MKRLLLVLFIGAIVLTACQTKTMVLPVDLTAEKVAVAKALDAHWEAVKAKDGNSAIAFEQMVLKPFSHKLPVRTVYHLVKANNIWLFDFTSVGFIPKNEDIDRLNKALE